MWISAHLTVVGYDPGPTNLPRIAYCLPGTCHATAAHSDTTPGNVCHEREERNDNPVQYHTVFSSHMRQALSYIYQYVASQLFGPSRGGVRDHVST